MSTTSSLNVIAKIPQSAICSISNFLLSDKKLEERNCSKSLEKDCEKPVDFTNGFETVCIFILKWGFFGFWTHSQ